MAVGGYDEDLLLNPFYKSFVGKGKEIYNNAANNRWTICIPRKGTASKSSFNRQCFESHVLKPVVSGGNIYTTINNKEAKIDGSFIITTKGFEEVRSVKILFEETFFNQNEESYHVLCIDNPLDGASASQTSSLPVVQLETLQNCNDFLWTKSSSKACRNRLNELIQLYNSASKKIVIKSFRQSVDAANTLFSRAMEVCLKESRFRKPANADKIYMDNLKVAVETYMMDGVHSHIFKGVSSLCAERDSQFNKTTRNLSDLQLSDLHVNDHIGKNISKCKKIISNLNKFTTPLEKLYVLKLTIMAMSESSKTSNDEYAISSDDLLPALIFIMVKCQIPNWHANFTYMQDFHFSQSKNDEFQFYLASTEAAIEHIQSGRLNSMISMTHTQRVKMIDTLLQGLDLSDKHNSPSPVDTFFSKIQDHDVVGVLSSLKESAANMTQITESLCHPLCSCNMCERILTSRQHDNASVTVFSRDGIGCTALHQAAECGCEEIIYELIKNGAEVNATNYHGSTPMHFSSQRGHHKCMVLLTHYGGAVNAVDSASNTPLHLAAANGHELCIDFLLSSDCETRSSCKVDINGSNEDGDTALHIASRWGFGEIVLSLLKQGAKANVRNNKDYTPLECALNEKIKDIFSEIASPSNESLESLHSFDDSSENISSGYVLPDSPTTTRRKKEFSNLLKAISDGNTEMVRQKLGVCKQHEPVCEEPPPHTSVDAVEQLLCHPLCQCHKCALLQQRVVSEMVSINANMSNSEGVRPLHIASIHGFEDIVTILLKECAADPNVKTNVNQRTSLHLACQYNNIECVSLLLKNGARVNLKDNSGNTALHFCCTNGHIGPAILLLQGGANVHSANHRGNTPLHDAVRWDYLDITRLLLHYKAPLHVTNKMFLTPLQYARGGEVRTLLQRADSENDEGKDTTDEPRKIKDVKFDGKREEDDMFSAENVDTVEECGPADDPSNPSKSKVTVEDKPCTGNQIEPSDNILDLPSASQVAVENEDCKGDDFEQEHVAHNINLDVQEVEDRKCPGASAMNYPAISSGCGEHSKSCTSTQLSGGGALDIGPVSLSEDSCVQLSAEVNSFNEVTMSARIAELINEAIDDDDDNDDDVT